MLLKKANPVGLDQNINHVIHNFRQQRRLEYCHSQISNTGEQ